MTAAGLDTGRLPLVKTRRCLLPVSSNPMHLLLLLRILVSCQPWLAVEDLHTIICACGGAVMLKRKTGSANGEVGEG